MSVLCFELAVVMTVFRRPRRALLCGLTALAAFSVASLAPVSVSAQSAPSAPEIILDICAEAEPEGRWGRIERPMRMQRVRMDGEIWILAQGEITTDSPRFLSEAIAKPGEASPRGVILQSRGGRLQAGLEMGRIIRANGLETRAGGIACPDSADDSAPGGQQSPDGLGLPTVPNMHEDPGICASACAYAFLGGSQRQSQPGALGFHRISAIAPAGMEAEEIAAAETEMLRDLLLYVLAMGAEAELVGLAQVTPAAALARPAAADLSRLGIVTDATTDGSTPARALQLAAL